jgi:hypothetical protein
VGRGGDRGSDGVRAPATSLGCQVGSCSRWS